jgi:DNA-binding XRE family transcriptional regulator
MTYRMMRRPSPRPALSAPERRTLVTSAKASGLVASLAELRRHRGITQVQLAESLERAQPSISALENADDNYLSTIDAVVGALGGRLELVAVFRGERIVLAL